MTDLLVVSLTWTLCAALLVTPVSSIPLDQGDIRLVVQGAEKFSLHRNIVAFISNGLREGSYAAVSLRSLAKQRVDNVLIIGVQAGEDSDNTGHFDASVSFSDHVVATTQKPQCDQPDLRRFLSCWRLKYTLELVRAGFNVFQADLDILYFSNPFDHFSTKNDVEIMSDGVIEELVYGYPILNHTPNNVDKEPGLWEFRINGLNIGCMFVRSTEPSIELFEAVLAVLNSSSHWEQKVVSYELMHRSVMGKLRMTILNPWLFTNSGFLERHAEPEFKPVLLHSSHHGDKHKMLLDALSLTRAPMKPVGQYTFDHNGPYGEFADVFNR